MLITYVAKGKLAEGVNALAVCFSLVLFFMFWLAQIVFFEVVEFHNRFLHLVTDDLWWSCCYIVKRQLPIWITKFFKFVTQVTFKNVFFLEISQLATSINAICVIATVDISLFTSRATSIIIVSYVCYLSLPSNEPSQEYRMLDCL